MAARRLTRKEIKEDAIGEGIASTSEWVVRHGRTLLMGLGAIALAILIGYFWTLYQGQRRAQLQGEFTAALKVFHGTVAPPPAPASEESEAPLPPTPEAAYDFQSDAERAEAALEAFKALADEHPGQRLGELSRYYVGLAQRDLGRQAEAEATLSGLAESSRFPDVRDLARNALALALSSNGDHAGAAEQLQAILTDASPEFPTRMTLLSLAREYEAGGETALAVEVYRRILNEYPTSEDARGAQSKLDQLEPTLPISPTSEAPEEPPDPAPAQR